MQEAENPAAPGCGIRRDGVVGDPGFGFMRAADPGVKLRELRGRA